MESALNRPPALLWLAVPALVAFCVAYAPALGAEFIWDDDAHLTPAGLRSGAGLLRIWTELGATQQYYPVLHSTFWLEHRLWGGSPLGYHVATILIHLAAAWMLVRVLTRLEIPGAMLAGALFALHPVHVESVAWISEQKNTLSTLFYLSSALWYLRFDASRDGRSYGLASLFFILALLTKTVTATLPAALLVLIWWRRGRVSCSRDLAPLSPWLVVGAGAGLFTAWVERTVIGAEGAAFDLTGLQRGLLAAHVPWFYVGKLVWPAGLTFNYARWSINPSNLIHWVPLIALLLTLFACWRTRARTPLAVALLFLGGLFPVLGFFNVYPFQYSYVADHFQYLASAPILAVVAAVGSRLVPVVARLRFAPPACALALLGPLALLGREQSATYHDNLTLFRATIARNPASWMAHNNLGRELMNERDRLPSAISHFERALVLRPTYPEAHNNLGLALTQLGRSREAIPHFRSALELKPNSFQTHNNLGIALAGADQPGDAVLAFAQAAALSPNHPNIQENWAKALLLLGNQAEAQQRFELAARLRRKPPP